MKITPFTFDPLVAEEAKNASNASFVLEDFGVPQTNPVEEAEEVPPPPTFSEEEMEQAKKESAEEAFLAGKKEGLREAEKEQQQSLEAMTIVLSRVEEQLSVMQLEHQKKQEEQQSGLAQLILAAAQRVAGEALRRDGLSDIEEMIQNCLSGLFEVPDLLLIAHPDVIDGLKEKLPKQVSFQADEALNPADCRLQWQHGEAIRDTESLWNEIDSRIQRHFAGGEVTKPNEGEANE
jgi:flagellar assembly protein FliH